MNFASEIEEILLSSKEAMGPAKHRPDLPTIKFHLDYEFNKFSNRFLVHFFTDLDELVGTK